MQEIFIYIFFTKDNEQIHCYFFLCKVHIFLQYSRLKRWFQSSFRLLMPKCLTGLMKPWELTFHRIWFHPDQRLGWNYTVKLTQVCQTAWKKSYRKVHQFLSSCCNIFLPSNGLEINREIGAPWIRFQMVQFLSWLEL